MSVMVGGHDLLFEHTNIESLHAVFVAIHNHNHRIQFNSIHNSIQGGWMESGRLAPGLGGGGTARQREIRGRGASNTKHKRS